MRPSTPALTFLLASLAAGCAQGGPYSLDLSVVRKTTGKSTTTSFFIEDGSDPGERKGTIGTGENCVVAMQSSGTRTTTRKYEVEERFNVIGETEAELPLVPGEEEASKVWASILRDSRRIAASSETVESTVDPSQDPSQYTITSYADDAITTRAGYHAVAADEFVVRMELADLYLDLEDELTFGDVELMTKNDPDEGDVWPSQNGNSVFVVYDTKYPRTVGADERKVTQIQVYGTGTVSPEGTDTAVYDQCFHFGLTQSQDSRPEVEAVNQDTMLLDPGCTGSFQHVKEGTEYWYDNVLVGETATVTHVTINEYGFAWTEEDEASGTCTRVVSDRRENANAKPFVQYDVTVTELTTTTATYND